MPRRALLSVSDKAGLPAFARGLARLGFELYSTGGTLQALEDAAIDVEPVTRLTGFPEILDGRVKTLHPGVHAGLLARRELGAHMAALEENGLRTIDLVCCNLYPFAETVAGPQVSLEQGLEQIDVGGPAMLRAAAKNHLDVIVICRPERYSEVLTALQEGDVPLEMRRRLAAEAFTQTAAYDAYIAGWLREQLGDTDLPAELTLAGSLVQRLRYGENPHQAAAFYRTGADPGGLASAHQLQGKELSFNNIQDAAAAYSLVNDYQQPAAAIIKHTNPCGVAVAAELAEAYRRAYDCDPVSAFGGVVALNRPLDVPTAEQLAGLFLEVIVAPDVPRPAAELLAQKSNLRVLSAGPVRSWGFDVRSVPGGLLAQTWDQPAFDRGSCRVVSLRPPSDAEWDLLAFAWVAAKHVKSNAAVIANGLAAVGVGAGQMSRVEAVQIAARRAGDRAQGGVLASDGFFPFPDGIQEGLRAGVTAVIAPGGSRRDPDVIAAADAAGAAFVMAAERHFRH